MHAGIKALASITGFAARHFLAVALGAFIGCIIWTLLYIGLLIYAMFSGGGLGGPLAYPGGIIAIIVACVLFGWGIFAPASGFGAIFCALLGLPRLAAIPVVFLGAFVLSHLLYWAFISFGTTHSMPSSWIIFKNFSLFLSVPLGIYWWLTEGPGAIIDTVRRLFSKWRSRSNLLATR
jgi:hypothetical protein